MTTKLTRHAPGSYRVVGLDGVFIERDPLDTGDDRWYVLEDKPGEPVRYLDAFDTRKAATAYVDANRGPA